MLACVTGSMLWMNNWQVQVFTPLILIEPLSKLPNWRAEKHYFLSKYRFSIFTNKIIRSTLTLYVANLGINVIIIGVAQQRKPKFSLLCKIFTKLHNLPSKNIPFFQNADSRFLMNTVIHSILTLFTSCKHRHQCYVGIIQIFELLIFKFFQSDCDLEMLRTWNIISRAPHGFMHD